MRRRLSERDLHSIKYLKYFDWKRKACIFPKTFQNRLSTRLLLLAHRSIFQCSRSMLKNSPIRAHEIFLQTTDGTKRWFRTCHTSHILAGPLKNSTILDYGGSITMNRSFGCRTFEQKRPQYGGLK